MFSVIFSGDCLFLVSDGFCSVSDGFCSVSVWFVFDARLLFHISKAFFHKNFPIGLEPISIPLITNPTPGIHFNTFQDKPIITA